MNSEWKCPMGDPIELVNEGYGICLAPAGVIWHTWSFNGDTFDGSSSSFYNFPLPGQKSYCAGRIFFSREEAISFIQSRRPEPVLIELPPPPQRKREEMVVS